jgi:thioredoxin
MAVKQQFASFQEMLDQSTLPVLVDFYATWCGPCKMMAEILEQVGEQMRGKIKIVKIDTDKYPHLASQNQIQALPTLVMFKHGQPIQRFEGVLPAPQLIANLQNLL